MRKSKIDHWIVIEGTPIFTCRTRKQAREYVKKHKVSYPKFSYVGKCINNYRFIVLDV